jgi:hypothetical protein
MIYKMFLTLLTWINHIFVKFIQPLATPRDSAGAAAGPRRRCRDAGCHRRRAGHLETVQRTAHLIWAIPKAGDTGNFWNLKACQRVVMKCYGYCVDLLFPAIISSMSAWAFAGPAGLEFSPRHQAYGQYYGAAQAKHFVEELLVLVQLRHRNGRNIL